MHEAGEEVVQETYDYDPDRDTLTPHRSKEEAEDYRYFPEPDLVPVEPEAATIERVAAELPELPAARVERVARAVGYEGAWELVTTGRDASSTSSRPRASTPRTASNVVRNEAAGVEIARARRARADRRGARPRFPRDVYLEAVGASATPGFTADKYLAQELRVRRSELAALVDQVLAANPDQVEAYRGGKTGLLGFFVGQVMKESQGRANPKLVSELVERKLGG